MHSIRFRIRSRSGQWLFRGHSFLKRRRRPSADALVRMAGDRSGSLTGSARQAPSLGPLFRARPHPGRCAGTSKVCGHPSAPCAAASALRHWPPRRGAAGYGPPLLRGFGLPLRVTTPPGTQAPGSVGLGLSPPVPARRSAAVSAPRSPRYALRAARTAPALGPAARPWAAPGGPAARPTRHCGFASGPSAPLPRRVPPKTAPSASCPPSSLGRLAAWAGCGLRSSRPGPGAALAVRFLRPPAPGALGRRQMQQRDSGVIQGGFRLIERSLGGGEPPQRLPCITLNLICC